MAAPVAAGYKPPASPQSSDGWEVVADPTRPQTPPEASPLRNEAEGDSSANQLTRRHGTPPEAGDAGQHVHVIEMATPSQSHPEAPPRHKIFLPPLPQDPPIWSRLFCACCPWCLKV